MRRLFFISILLSFTLISIGQVYTDSEISVKFLNENGRIQLVCENDNTVAGNFSMQIVLKNLDNIRSPNVINRVITPGSIIATLTPEDPRKGYNLGSFTYRYFRGSYTAKPNLELVYRLPFSTSRSAIVGSMNFIGSKYGDQKTPEDWRPFYFSLDKGDTIYAARRGKVVAVVDGEDFWQTDGHVSYNSALNYIYVEHTDGTYAKYNVLAKGSIMVKLWDVVTPSTPIALAGTLDGNKWQLRFELMKTELLTGNTESRPFVSRHINPIFATSQGNLQLVIGEEYQPIVTTELIEAEMKKKKNNRRAK